MAHRLRTRIPRTTQRMLDSRHHAGRIRHAARILGAAALVLFCYMLLNQGFPRSIDQEAWEKQVQAIVLLFVATGYAAALRWEWLGGAMMLMGAIALGVLASVAVEPLRSLLGALIFSVPGALMLVLWAREQRVPAVLGVGAGMAVFLAIGAYGANAVYDDFYGPSHPESPLERLPVEHVEWIWAGGVTADSATVTARIARNSNDVRLAISDAPDLTDASRVGPASANEDANHRIVSFTAGALQPDTTYYYAIEVDGDLDMVRAGRVRTFPEGPASFVFAFGSCTRRGSNGAVFDTIRALDPLFFVLTGDSPYSDIASNDLDAFLDDYDEMLTSPAQQELYRSLAIARTWDDHDFGSNGADGTSASRPAAQRSYRLAVPHYPLSAGDDEGPIYQAFNVGRVRFILTDSRSHRTPSGEPDGPEKTMLGAEQKAWFKEQLLLAREQFPVIVWVSSSPWNASGGDSWGRYATERQEIANFIIENDISGLVMLSGDAHMLAIDDGTNTNFSSYPGRGFPLFHAAALDRRGKVKGGPYSEGAYPGGGQFGLMTVADDGGGSIRIQWSGRDYTGEEIVALDFTVPVNDQPNQNRQEGSP